MGGRGVIHMEKRTGSGSRKTGIVCGRPLWTSPNYNYNNLYSNVGSKLFLKMSRIDEWFSFHNLLILQLAMLRNSDLVRL